VEWLAAMFEILLLAGIFYYTLRFLQGTRGAQVLTGLVVALLFLFGVTYLFHLDVLNWLLSKLFVYLAIGFLIIFQPEIRHALAELGRPAVFSMPEVKRNVVDQIVQATSFLAERRIGGLIAIERDIKTKSIQESGVKMDCSVTWGILASIFFPHTPLHDGGVIISEDRIVAAGCLFPLSDKSGLSRTLGTRHRAAIGLSDETDAVVVVVSEETGTISISYRGGLSQAVEIERLRRFLYRVLLKDNRKKRTVGRIVDRFGRTSEGVEESGNQTGEGEANAVR